MRRLRRARRHIGRRGAFLVAHGVLFAAYGYSLDTVVDQPERLASYAVAISVMPIQTWAYLWGVVGALVVLAGIVRRLVSVAFGLLMGLSTMWTLNFALAQWVGEAPDRTWVGALLFGSLLASIAIVAGWRE